jgi:hypothetical protein
MSAPRRPINKCMIANPSISLESLFDAAGQGSRVACCWEASRRRATRDGVAVLLDTMPGVEADCLSLRATRAGTLRVCVERIERVEEVAGGGWLLGVGEEEAWSYWIPAAPKLHRLESLGRIHHDRVARAGSASIDRHGLTVTFEIPDGAVLDCAVWRLPPSIANGLRTLDPIESQGQFLWGSHTVFERPADLYRHIVHGLVYEDRYEWPKRWRVCSENDAHALFVCCAGLARSTGKQIYTLLGTQLLLAVLSRQDPDGGYRHGTWTDQLESHFRLHASAMHLLMDAFEQAADDSLRDALVLAAGFAARQVDHTDLGAWFLHDELEVSAEAMDRGPFRWIPSTVLGKAPSNMLVLNTHLDLLVAMHRFARLTGTHEYDELIESARQAALAVLRRAPAQGVYSVLFRLIELTMLPTPQAERLSLPLRALKRLTRDFVLPSLPTVKTRLPRLVMPNGYVDRALSIRNWSHRYLGINAMDLARAGGRFPQDSEFASTAENALRFAIRSGIAERWREAAADRYAIGFLAEALCRFCALDDGLVWRQWLAEQLLALTDLSLGFPPTLLGSNGEATQQREMVPCPSSAVVAVRAAVLQGPSGPEFLIINTASEQVAPRWLTAPPDGLRWRDRAGNPALPDAPLPGRSWLIAQARTGDVHASSRVETTAAPGFKT